MKPRVRSVLVLAGLTVLAACGSPTQTPSVTSPAQGMLAPPPPPSGMPTVPQLDALPSRAPTGPSHGFRVQDQRTYFHQHTGMWVWLSTAKRWAWYNTPENWNGLYGVHYTTMGYGNYGWWYIPFDYKGWVQYYANNRWYYFWGGFFGNRPIIQQ